MRFLPGNAQHIGARQYQQDSFGFADPDDAAFIQHGGFLAIVCDGMGGMEHGDLAGRTAVRAFLDAYGRKTQQEPVPAALERSVREANARVVALAHSLGRAEGVGTTLVAATLLDGGPGQARLYWVSVGDSGLFLVSGGQMRMVNHPHVFANQLDQAVANGRLSLDAAMTHPERDSLTSYIGAEVLEEIDLTPEPLLLSEGDTILLASDGMFKTLAPAEIVASLMGHPQSWPERLVHETLMRRKEGQDNVTVLSVGIEAEPVGVPQGSGIFARPADLAPNPPGYRAGQQTPSTIRIPQPEDMPPPVQASPAAVPPPAAYVPPPSQVGAPVGVPFGTQLAATEMVNTNWAQPSQHMGQQPGPFPGMASQIASATAPSVPKSGKLWVWLLVLVLLGGGGAGGWWWHKRHIPGQDTSAPKSTRPKDQGPPSAPELSPDRPIPPPDPGRPDAPPEQQPAKAGGGK